MISGRRKGGKAKVPAVFKKIKRDLDKGTNWKVKSDALESKIENLMSTIDSINGALDRESQKVVELFKTLTKRNIFIGELVKLIPKEVWIKEGMLMYMKQDFPCNFCGDTSEGTLACDKCAKPMCPVCYLEHTC